MTDVTFIDFSFPSQLCVVGVDVDGDAGLCTSGISMTRLVPRLGVFLRQRGSFGLSKRNVSMEQRDTSGWPISMSVELILVVQQKGLITLLNTKKQICSYCCGGALNEQAFRVCRLNKIAWQNSLCAITENPLEISREKSNIRGFSYLKPLK